MSEGVRKSRRKCTTYKDKMQYYVEIDDCELPKPKERKKKDKAENVVDDPDCSAVEIFEKIATKQPRRNNEKRKEKSRDAARRRRGKESEIFSELTSLLPLPQDELDHLDKASIMRLTITVLRTRNLAETSLGGSFDIKTDGGEDTKIIPVAKLKLDPGIDLKFDVLQAFNGFLLALTTEGEIVYASENISSYLGLSRVEVMGHLLVEYIHPCDQDDVRHVCSLKGNTWRCCFIRMKCTLTTKGRSVNLKSASYKVIQISGRLITPSSLSNMINIPTVKTESPIDFDCDSRDALSSNFSEDEKCLTTLESIKEESDDKGKAHIAKPPRSWVVATGIAVPHPSHYGYLNENQFVTKNSVDMRFLYIDESISKIIGFKPAFLVGRSYYEMIHALDSDRIRDDHKTLRQKGQVETGRYRFLSKGGGYVWILTQATLISGNREGKAPFIFCLHYVISGIEEKGLILSDIQLSASKSSEVKTATVDQPVVSSTRSLLKKQSLPTPSEKIKFAPPQQNARESANSSRVNHVLPMSSTRSLLQPITSSVKADSATPGPWLDRPKPSDLPNPVTSTRTLLSIRTIGMNTGFLKASPEDLSNAGYKNDIDDLTHLAPCAGDEFEQMVVSQDNTSADRIYNIHLPNCWDETINCDEVQPDVNMKKSIKTAPPSRNYGFRANADQNKSKNILDNLNSNIEDNFGQSTRISSAKVNAVHARNNNLNSENIDFSFDLRNIDGGGFVDVKNFENNDKIRNSSRLCSRADLLDDSGYSASSPDSPGGPSQSSTKLMRTKIASINRQTVPVYGQRNGSTVALSDCSPLSNTDGWYDEPLNSSYCSADVQDHRLNSPSEGNSNSPMTDLFTPEPPYSPLLSESSFPLLSQSHKFLSKRRDFDSPSSSDQNNSMAVPQNSPKIEFKYDEDLDEYELRNQFPFSDNDFLIDPEEMMTGNDMDGGEADASCGDSIFSSKGRDCDPMMTYLSPPTPPMSRNKLNSEVVENMVDPNQVLAVQYASREDSPELCSESLVRVLNDPCNSPAISPQPSSHVPVRREHPPLTLKRMPSVFCPADQLQRKKRPCLNLSTTIPSQEDDAPSIIILDNGKQQVDGRRASSVAPPPYAPTMQQLLKPNSAGVSPPSPSPSPPLLNPADLPRNDKGNIEFTEEEFKKLCKENHIIQQNLSRVVGEKISKEREPKPNERIIPQPRSTNVKSVRVLTTSGTNNPSAKQRETFRVIGLNSRNGRMSINQSLRAVHIGSSSKNRRLSMSGGSHLSTLMNLSSQDCEVNAPAQSPALLQGPDLLRALDETYLRDAFVNTSRIN